MAKRRRTAKRPPLTRAQGPKKRRFASIYPGKPPHEQLTDRFALPPGLAESVEELEKELQLPVWLLVQDEQRQEDDEDPWKDSFNSIGEIVASAFFSSRHNQLKRGQRIALLIDSRGGHAGSSYAIAMLLRRHCGGFVAIVPRHAKSAATLLTLGADEIIMNDHAELGPLDVQIWDPDREDLLSGLDEVQSLERLQAFAMEALDRMMLLLLRRTRKKTKTLLPFVTEFVTKLTHPMFQGIDVVRYTQMSRALKVAEEYGKRLLRRKYGPEADDIANILVTKFPEHGFPIYPDEARQIGLDIASMSPSLSKIIEQTTRYLPNMNVLGSVIE